MKAVRFDEYGELDVLKVIDVPTPEPGPGQVSEAYGMLERGHILGKIVLIP